MKKEGSPNTVRPVTAAAAGGAPGQCPSTSSSSSQMQPVRPNSCRAPPCGKRQQQQGMIMMEGGGGGGGVIGGSGPLNCTSRQKYNNRGQQKRQQMPMGQNGSRQGGQCPSRGYNRGGSSRFECRGAEHPQHHQQQQQQQQGGGGWVWKGGQGGGSPRQGTGDRKNNSAGGGQKRHNRYMNGGGSSQQEGDRLRSAPPAPCGSRRPPAYRGAPSCDTRQKYYKGYRGEPREGRRIASATFRPVRCDPLSKEASHWPPPSDLGDKQSQGQQQECPSAASVVVGGSGAAPQPPPPQNGNNNPNRPLYYSEVARTPQKDQRKDCQQNNSQGRRRANMEMQPRVSLETRQNIITPFTEIYRFPKVPVFGDHQRAHLRSADVDRQRRSPPDPPCRPWSRGAGQTNSAWTELRPYYSVLPSRPRPSASANWRWATLDRAVSPERDRETNWRAVTNAPAPAAATPAEGENPAAPVPPPTDVVNLQQQPTVDEPSEVPSTSGEKLSQNKETKKHQQQGKPEKEAGEKTEESNKKLTELEKVVKELGISTGVPSCEAVLALRNKNISDSLMKIFEESFKAEFNKAEIEKSNCTNLSEIEKLIAAESADVEYALKMKELQKSALPKLTGVQKLSPGTSLEELRNQLKPLKDQDEILEPEVAAAILQALERDKGLELNSSPQFYFRKLFPSLGESDIRGKVSSFKGLDKSIVVPMSPDNPNCRMKTTILEDAAMMDYLKGVAYDKDFPKIQDQPESKDAAEAFGVIEEEGDTGDGGGHRGEPSFVFTVNPKSPERVNYIRIRGTQPPPWFPGYYYSVPGSEVLKEAKNPLDVLDKAWRAVNPTGVKTKEGTVVIGT